jgi:hypothetical protein
MSQLVQTLIGLLSKNRESELERYLAESANLADVERRTREWESKHRESHFTDRGRMPERRGPHRKVRAPSFSGDRQKRK